MIKYNICIQKLNCAVLNCLEIALHGIGHFEKIISKQKYGRGLCANLHNFKTCITFDSVGMLKWGFQQFGFLITVI